jgi:hypothetical protein
MSEPIAAAAGRPMTDAEVREALGGEEPGPTLTAEEEADWAEENHVTAEPPGCPHPPSERRLENGQQVCLTCGQTVEPWERQAIVPRERPGTSDPTRRPGDDRSGGLQFVTIPTPGVQGRPYTADQVEQEIVVLLDRLERGQGWLTTKEEERAAAQLAYDLAFAKARFNSDARSAEQRNDDALLQSQDLYEEVKLLDLQCRTARDGLHSLRSSLSALQSVLKSVNAVMGAYR